MIFHLHERDVLACDLCDRELTKENPLSLEHNAKMMGWLILPDRVKYMGIGVQHLCDWCKNGYIRRMLAIPEEEPPF